MIPTTNVQATHAGGTITCPCAVSKLTLSQPHSLIYVYTHPTVAVLLLLAPHPSILHVLLNYHYLTLHATRYFLAHLLVIYTLSFLAFSSLIVCVARDPGPVPEAKPEVQQDAGGDISLEDALLSTPPEDYTQPGKWCRICWRPKPERTHHCSQCGRCVLKMGVCCY